MLLILVPVLNRPHRVQPLLDAFTATTPEARVLFICDPTDFPEQQAVRRAGGGSILVGGNYAQKIAAGVKATDEPLVFLAADDLQPHQGWFEAASARLRDGVEVIGVNDLRPRDGEHATHFLLTRRYCEQPTIDGGTGPMHAGYHHNYPDRELIETARRRGVYAYAPDAIVEHLHHLDGKAEHDDTYKKGEQSFRLDARLFRRRSRLWAA